MPALGWGGAGAGWRPGTNRHRRGRDAAGMRPGCGCAPSGLCGAGRCLSQAPSSLGRGCPPGPLPRSRGLALVPVGIACSQPGRWLAGPCAGQARERCWTSRQGVWGSCRGAAKEQGPRVQQWGHRGGCCPKRRGPRGARAACAVPRERTGAVGCCGAGLAPAPRLGSPRGGGQVGFAGAGPWMGLWEGLEFGVLMRGAWLAPSPQPRLNPPCSSSGSLPIPSAILSHPPDCLSRHSARADGPRERCRLPRVRCSTENWSRQWCG